jgi:hypothetical protein
MKDWGIFILYTFIIVIVFILITGGNPQDPNGGRTASVLNAFGQQMRRLTAQLQGRNQGVSYTQ